MENKNILLAEITNNIVQELEKRIDNINNQIHLLNKEDKKNFYGQIVGIKESIKIVQNEFMKSI